MLKKTATGLGAILALLILFQGLAIAAPAQITTDPARQGRPDVHDNVIVWKDLRAGNWDIYRYNLNDGDESLVADNLAYQNLPITNGLFILWQDNRSGNFDIYIEDALVGFEQPLVTGPGNQGISDISGSIVVYVDDSGGNNDIYAIDLSTGETTAIATGPSNQWQPRISGQRVVWQDDRNGKSDIYSYDMTSQVEEPVAVGPGEHSLCDIDGSRAVWEENNGSQYDIYLKDLDSGSVQAITDDAAYQTAPRISGDLIVWQDYRNDSNPGDSYYDYDIYMYDLTSGIESQLAGGPSIAAYPAIDREKVVWEDTAAGNYDVWMATVPDETAPRISEPVPEDGAVSCSEPYIGATLSDNRAGIDTGSVTLTLDGADVTADATITESSISYQPGELEPGPHTVFVTAADLAGNSSTEEWQFSSGTPNISIDHYSSYWESIADYINHILSVSYTIKNDDGSPDAHGVQILASPASVGVFPVSLPTDEQEIAGGGQVETVVRYLIPPGVVSFWTGVYINARDDCGGNYFFPGPPPT